jgi:hypothetical protein
VSGSVGQSCSSIPGMGLFTGEGFVAKQPSIQIGVTFGRGGGGPLSASSVLGAIEHIDTNSRIRRNSLIRCKVGVRLEWLVPLADLTTGVHGTKAAPARVGVRWNENVERNLPSADRVGELMPGRSCVD